MYDIVSLVIHHGNIDSNVAHAWHRYGIGDANVVNIYVILLLYRQFHSGLLWFLPGCRR